MSGSYSVTRRFCGTIVFVWSRWFYESPSTARTRLCSTSALLGLQTKMMMMMAKKMIRIPCKYITSKRADIYWLFIYLYIHTHVEDVESLKKFTHPLIAVVRYTNYFAHTELYANGTMSLCVASVLWQANQGCYIYIHTQRHTCIILSRELLYLH